VAEQQDEAAPVAADVPPTRPSRLSVELEPSKFPDDGPVSGLVRTIDHYVGNIELAILLALFVSVVAVASLSALSTHIGHHQIGLWWTWVVRKGTFAIALLGAAYATQQQRLLAMDLVSRKLSPRGRLLLGIALKLFTAVLAGVLVYIGLYMHEHADHHAGPHLDLTLFVLSEKDAMCVIPIGGALIVLHSLLHAAIEVDYLVRGKLLPERARSGH
jgi:TRAP-type C4-dicarboxylate transport system permease small subunit